MSHALNLQLNEKTMSSHKTFAAAMIVLAMSILACKYVVVPTDLQPASSVEIGEWSAFATKVTKSDSGMLHIDLTLRNDTGDWSAMQAVEGIPAILTTQENSVNCETVRVATGGHRLTPGFQMRGYTDGTIASPETQLIYVECAEAEAGTGSKLTIDYFFVTGQYNYYEQDKNRVDAKLNIDLDKLIPETEYPVAELSPDAVVQGDAEITAINEVALKLVALERNDTGLQFTWQTANPGEYPTYVHIGNPPVIGQDGILYGFYETPDIVSVPLSPAGGNVEWTTQVAVPQEVDNLYILLSVETGKARLFANYAIDITDK
jgi:hypothetical protein